MSSQRLDATLEELGVPIYVNKARQTSIARRIASRTTPEIEQENPERLPRLGFVYESQGVQSYQRSIGNNGDDAREQAREHFKSAFTCWVALASLPSPYPNVGIFAALQQDVSTKGLSLVERELYGTPLRSELTLAFRIAVAGLVANNSPETRLQLESFALSVPLEELRWGERVAESVFSAFALLVRKAGGWRDVEQALQLISSLRQLQQDFEDSYIESYDTNSSQVEAAVELVGLYHLAQLVTLTGEYLRDGSSTPTQVNARLDRHHERATTAFISGNRSLFSHLSDLLWIGCRELTFNSIWTHVQGVGESVREFARVLTSRGRPNPVIELWPGQQEALRRNLLDPYRRAVLVEMPTSAGKTLLAKFAIVQTYALNPNGTIAYIVPTRALVNQITLDLRADFRHLEMGLTVEQAVPAFELDPTEERLLGTTPAIIVTTPEKLDLLVRRNHPATQNLTLVIADEAHNLREGERGARLELLLGMIKRDRINARFLLLSPFLPNGEELVVWLGEERAVSPIHLEWKPANKIVGAVRALGRGTNRQLLLETLPASDNSDIDPGINIPLGSGASVGSTVREISVATVQALRERGSVLILCRGKGTSIARAKEIAEVLPEQPHTDSREAVCRYIEAEAGRRTALIDCIQHGVAYHHAGLSHEVRWLVESLIRNRDVDVVCGTTTLAQGMNFPVTTVVVETLRKGSESLTYQDFWNIAGRAGRTLVDTVGVVAYPAGQSQRRERFIEFLSGEALEISSQLAELVQDADEIANQFNLSTVYRWPKLAALMQFLAHAMRVAGNVSIADEVEDVMRASLVYHQSRAAGPDAARRLIDLCRSYVQHVQGTPSQQGLLTLADHTGFSTPSVLNLLAQKTQSSELASVPNWSPNRLFGDDVGPLETRIEAIASLPEMRLGQGTDAPFSARRVAEILRDWVRGETLDVLTERYWVVDEGSDLDERIAGFSNYLFSSLLGRASWGIGALEGIALAGTDQTEWADAAYVPSMIFFGVQRREAVWLRMVGVPRFVADGMAQLWQSGVAGEPQTYDEIRTWVSKLSDSEWESVIPGNSVLRPEDMRLLWEQFAAA